MAKDQTTILLIEDEPISLTVTRRMLLAGGYNVIVAQNGIEAELCIAQGQFDAVVLDLYLPYRSGFTLLQSLKAMAVRMPVIVVSAFISHDTLKVLTQARVRVILRKPITAAELLDAVEKVICK